MDKNKPNPLDNLDDNEILRALVEGTASKIGIDFFKALAENLHKLTGVYGAWVSEYTPGSNTMRGLGLWLGDKHVDDFVYEIEGTPCADVLARQEMIHIPDKAYELYPLDSDMREAGCVSYVGAPLLDSDGAFLGHLAVMNNVPMPEEPRTWSIFRIFANRAGAELRRLRAEQTVRENEEKLRSLLDSAMDAIIELDSDLHITMVNAAFEKALSFSDSETLGKNFCECLVPASAEKLQNLIAELDSRPKGKRYLWIPGGLRALSTAGAEFSAEATLSHYELHGKPYYTLILRNINDRLEAEAKINSLTAQTKYLREQIKELQVSDEIIGESRAMLKTLQDVKQVANTDATVLITGETGSGKELIARAIHNTSNRKEKALIKVNCAAIPAALIESEFFGHEKGAFTGATQKREGRFALANGGTIFLDEIGELPLDLQSKLLRVLQEGEFDPVGSSQTTKVDVRVIAATNRDLLAESKAGNFREDLFYRLNVFPIDAPALRERDNDVIMLANVFAKNIAAKMGKSIAPLTEHCAARLRSYDWPGNVRELQNVIERAVITADGDKLNLDRSLPADATSATPSQAEVESNSSEHIMNAEQFITLERDNIIRALEKTNWKVSGSDGAAELLGLKSTTLSSRIKALKITR